MSWAIVGAGLIATASGWQSLHAEPLIMQDAAPQDTPLATPAEPLVDLTDLTRDDLLHDAAPPVTASVNATNLPRSGSMQSRTTTGTPAPDNSAPLHNVIKESVRPVYNELVESGALETWRDVKETLGLSKKNWGRHDADGEVNALQRPHAANTPGWQDPAMPPKSAAQAQLDREYDAYLLRQLIDDIKPWALGLIGLYALGYLAKLIFNFMQWKAARRREHRAQRARHRSSRPRYDSKREL
ncbi:MAG: hypothetical protein GW848_04230 [Rhodoferax sp.]|nr:hypothetical protein [Rhodoferax sp.]OIP25535.1 MAG: hypothetical protein AUK52_00250 [Comamonadaceae bacterium CG2_30_60_41]PIW08389.1 MAG: hypothetical protein COW39_09835 [Comamonadaceae bacterium CG17_big_fil_post_rev_8_21_14_2_50_60_13]PIY27301.1 MAG: hypothetical protein COZ10_00415 [Comamonadaceae bacterium CG_4_10_14_3_um_filter_60_75]PJC15795.1 MAG: hypothetical protein CO066_03665 [Comamonadaceae bacterium CG_4_9_14_0_8_um_filter_60_18]